MHIETLRIFCDLAELRSFSKTADKNHVSQSAVTQQIQQLELAHNTQLLERKKRPLELTASGQLFYTTCKDMVERYERFKSELNALQKAASHRINVAAIFSIGMHTLPEYVKKFMVKYPNVHVHLEYFSSDRVYELVIGGEVDIGLVAVPTRDKRLEVYDFEDELLVLVCSTRHPLASESEVDIHKIQGERFIGFDRSVPTRTWIDNILARYNIALQPVMEFDNIETVKRAVEINSGISILPKTAIEQEVSIGTLKAVEFSNEKFYRPTGIIVRKDRILSQAGRNFIEMLRKKDK